MRWKHGKNITNNPYIYDNQDERQYWLDDEGYLVACILNKYEERVDELMNYIASKHHEMPAVFDLMISSITHMLKMKFKSVRDRKSLKTDEGWEVVEIEKHDGVTYEIKLSIKELKK